MAKHGNEEDDSKDDACSQVRIISISGCFYMRAWIIGNAAFCSLCLGEGRCQRGVLSREKIHG